MLLETLREELIKDIIEALDENIVGTIQSRQSVHSLVTQIIVDSFDEYECKQFAVRAALAKSAHKIGVYDGNLFEKANAKKPGGCICTRRAKANAKKLGEAK